MKQVIVKIKNEKEKVISKFYYTSQGQFFSYAFKDIIESINSNFKDCYELDIKIGNQYRLYKSIEEIYEDAAYYGIDFDEQVSNYLNSYDIKYYVKEYLPNI